MLFDTIRDVLVLCHFLSLFLIVNGNDMNGTNYSLVVGVVCGFCGDGPLATDGVIVPDTVSSTGLAGAAALS